MYTDKELKIAVEKSCSYAETLRNLGVNPTGSSHKCIKKRIDNSSINIDHFTKKTPKISGKKHWSEILIHDENLKFRRDGKRLTQALLEQGRKHVCVGCGNCGNWNEKLIILEVDHVDGNWRNNKPDNLRFMCPNCHSQTENFYNIPSASYCLCGNRKYKKSEKCLSCHNRIQKNRKVDRPTKEELEKLVWEKPTTHVALDFGVSDKSISKWCKSYNIEKPPRGYWNKKR